MELGKSNSKEMIFGRCMRISVVVCVLICGLAGTGLIAQSKQGAQKKPAASKPTMQVCGKAALVNISPGSPKQGSLVLVRVWSMKHLDEVTAAWDGNVIPIWRTLAWVMMPNGMDWWEGLFGVDLENEVGKHDLKIADKVSGEGVESCNLSIVVSDGGFATEKLTVAPQFVEPNAEQLARAQEESKRLHEIYATVTPEKLWNGRFRIPLTGAKTGGNFGKRRVLNGEPSSPHSGVDFPAPTGTHVHAAQRGRVVLAEPLYFSGNTVVVDHGLGVYTFYGHLSAIGVKVGDSVEAGAVLGKVGATGRVTGPHLHWGLEVNRARVNALDITKIQSLGMRGN